MVDLVTMEAFYYTPGGDGRGKITGEIPASVAHQAKEAHEALVELVAEGKDELMEEYFAEGTIPEQHLITALHEAIREDRIFPCSLPAAWPIWRPIICSTSSRYMRLRRSSAHQSQ